MELWLRTDLKENHGLEKVDIGETEGTSYFTFDSSKEKVALGTISFRVREDRLPEIVKKFSTVQGSDDPLAGTDFLVQVPDAKTTLTGWKLGICTEPGPEGEHRNLNYKTGQFGTAELRYTFNFPETIISVAAAEPAVTVNAYQAYTHGDKEDLDLVMQKYSPMVTATYADGTRRSFLFPWQGLRVTSGLGDPYDPTRGGYRVEQDFYEMKSGGRTKFPVPVSADLAVTPVTLTGVTADDLTRTWPLGDNLLNGVKSANDLGLPTEARLLTDVVPGTLSLTMPIQGWTPTKAGSKWPTGDETMELLIADEDESASPTIHWPTQADGGRWKDVYAQRRGTYTFAMAASYGGAPTRFQQADIQSKWPWLTVPQKEYPLDPATRHLVGEWDEKGDPKDKILETGLYRVKYVQTVTDHTGHPELTLSVRRMQGTSTEIEVDMAEKTLFRVRLPNGLELGTGVKSTGAMGGTVTVPDWFTGESGSYTSTRKETSEGSNTHTYDLTTSPGDTAASFTHAAQREVLRRYINLGGWFSVSINEDPDSYAWTDFIPVYVPPRQNVHTSNKEYNFLGSNAGLFGWPGGLGTTVTLPRGSYEPVNQGGKPIYLDANGNDTLTVTEKRKTEPYGVPTTYNGATGAEPGLLHTFTVKGTQGKWPTGTVGGVTTYGPAPFLDGKVYSAYGRVDNPDSRTATLRKEHAFPPADLAERVILTYEGSTGVSFSGENVSLVTYDTRTEGYTTRQDYTLVLKNVGDVDVYDLDIDTITGGGHYVLLDPPADFLPVGASTTFKLSYTYGLNTQADDYRDTLYVTSSRHPVSKTDDLLDFDARFTVSDTDTHKVSVKVDPANGSMGTAGVIIGEDHQAEGKPPYTMNTTPGTTTFHAGETVYIAVTPKDEYTIEKFEVVDGSGASLSYTEYAGGDGAASGGAELPEGVLVYTFTMPDYDTTVTVTFEEGIYSKLRLSDLTVYADPSENSFQTPTDETPPAPANVPTAPAYPVWQKGFTAAETKEALTRGEERSAPYGQYLMTRGKAEREGFDSRVGQYIVVLPYDADWAQVESTLRKVVLGGADAQIKPSVAMRLYPKDYVDGSGSTGDPILTSYEGDTGVPTIDRSRVFSSPEPGASNYVEIEVFYKPSTTTETISRFYYVELHRAPKDPIATPYDGNSPYGMIMNAANLDGTTKDDHGLTAKDRAKAAFVNNGYSFAGLAKAYVPEKAAGLTARYHTEAWVDAKALYEPESHTGTDPAAGIYRAEDNMDLSDEALFAVLGQAFEDPGLKSALDSTGRPADLSKATLAVEVITLDAAKNEQVPRFAGPDPADKAAVAARTVTLIHGAITTDLETAVTVPADWIGDRLIRPGLYELEYRYPDYSGDTLVVRRPLILLAPVGDVNGDLKVETTGDVAGILGRMTDPLGYTAGEYPAAAIFKYRSCDVNNDRNINNIDANQLRAGVKIVFYYPTNYR